MASLGVLYVLARLSGARIELGRLRRLHADQQGSVQSLSFVLTLPLFIMVLLFIVQVSQLMIGQIVVEYAAFAAARAAAVWIPAGLAGGEDSNCISSFSPDPAAPDQVPPSPAGPSDGGETFLVAPGQPEVQQDRLGGRAGLYADLALAEPGRRPVGPGRGDGGGHQGGLCRAGPELHRQPLDPARLENKLAYAAANTAVEIRFYHSNPSRR